MSDLRDYAGWGERLPAATERLERRLAESIEEMGRGGREEPKMKPWQLTCALAAAAALAALVIPRLDAVGLDVADAPPPEAVTASPPEEPPETPAEAAPDGAALAFSGGLAQPALLRGAGGDHFLVAEFRAPRQGAGPRQPVHVAVVVDVSGSMSADRKIDYARDATWGLLRALGPEDSFALVGFADEADVFLPAGPVGDGAAAYDAVAALAPFGSTYIADGLAAGIAQLEAVEAPGVKRVLLLSDGLSPEPHAELASLAASRVEQGITVSALGLGLNFDSDALVAISDAGGGRYQYAGEAEDLLGVFDEELRALSGVASRGVALEVALAEGVEVLDVYGYEDFDGGRTARGYRAFVGDMRGGEVRKVVARLRIPDDAEGALEVAQLTARYTDPDSGARRETSAVARAVITADAATALASLDPDRGLHAAHACAGDGLAEGLARWKAGDAEAARRRFALAEAQLTALDSDGASAEIEALRGRIQDRARALEDTRAGTKAARKLNLDVQREAINACY